MLPQGMIRMAASRTGYPVFRKHEGALPRLFIPSPRWEGGTPNVSLLGDSEGVDNSLSLV